MPFIREKLEVTVTLDDGQELEFDAERVCIKTYGEIQISHDEMGMTLQNRLEKI